MGCVAGDDINSSRYAAHDVHECFYGLMKTGHRFRRSAPIAVVAAVAVAIVVLCWYYYSHDPSSGPSLKCTFKVLTGYDCPGCGSQRAFHALLHGRFALAWSYNPMVFFAVPAAVYYLIIESGRRRWPRLHAASVNPFIISAILIAITAFWIGRNI